MISNRQLFLKHLAQTSPAPLSLEIERAEGVYLYDTNGKPYIDLIAGISVSNVGHSHKDVVQAVNSQMSKHAHLMVYGEYVQYAQVKLAHELASLLPSKLQSVYFTNSGAEAVEGAVKLAKRLTQRPEVISFRNAYHGSTQGALSVMGSEVFKSAFRPLIPGGRVLEYNSVRDLEFITSSTACVIAEVVQAESGVIPADIEWLTALRKRCDETGALLVFDEIQTGLGRTGSMFAFEHYKVVPDILLLGKALGGGLPLGAFISSAENMNALTNEPVLGHITTFGGNPVCCAAALAALRVIKNEKLVEKVTTLNEIFYNSIQHPKIVEMRGKGLIIAVELESEEKNMQAISECIKRGVITDWFLFNSKSMRIAPPLVISEEQARRASKVIVDSISEVYA